jgi:proteasome lid subunit RPN8/RPN11
MIKVKIKDLEDIILHCKEEAPIEACGILAGNIKHSKKDTIKIIKKIFRCKNQLNSTTLYEIGAEEQYRIYTIIDDLGYELLGFYHSHPSTSTKPSSMDRKKSDYYGYSYIIVSLNPVKVSSWILEEKGIFKPEELFIEKFHDRLNN